PCLRLLLGRSDPVDSLIPYTALLRSNTVLRLLPSIAPFTNHPACLRILEGHSDEVDAVSLSADGRCAVSGSGDCTLRVWDINTGQCLRILEGHSDVDAVSRLVDGRCA